MANTKPIVDNEETLRYVLEEGKKTGIHVLSCAAISKGFEGKERTDMEGLLKAGAAGFTDDGIPLMDGPFVKEAMEEAARLDTVLSFHEEDKTFIKQNGINHGKVSDQLGIYGSPALAEDSLVARDCMIALATGAKIDIQHISSGHSVEMVRLAKKMGAHVWAEVTPHHFTLTEDAVLEHGTLAKMNPPLRTEWDRQMLIEGLKDGTIDMIATDHAPHSKEEKEKPLTEAPSGITGLETSLALGITSLVKPGWPMIIMLLGTHLYLTIRLRFPQLHILKALRLSVSKDKDAGGDVSQFGALATSLAATIGTGNIIGVATAVALGGPGAVFWCWLTGVLGMSTKYAEGLLAVKYRIKNSSGEMIGGPMYALERGLGLKWLGVLFCIFTALAAFGIGNTVQANSISLLLNESYGVSPHLTGILMSILTALVVIGGVKSIARVCMGLVPIMALLYVGGCIYILIVNHAYLGESFRLIFESAFSARAAGSGFIGTTVMMAARYGIARGLFSNESGLGSAPIVAAAAQTRNPVRQALVSSTGTFWDTVVICALTGLVLVSSILAYPDIDYTSDAALTKMAFAKIPYIGTPILSFGIVTFAFSTILGWTYYSQKAVEYLGGKKIMFAYRLMWILMIYVGSVINLTLVWNFADVVNALMAIPNLISLVLLSGVVVSETRKYLWNNRLNDYHEE